MSVKNVYNIFDKVKSFSCPNVQKYNSEVIDLCTKKTERKTQVKNINLMTYVPKRIPCNKNRFFLVRVLGGSKSKPLYKFPIRYYHKVRKGQFKVLKPTLMTINSAAKFSSKTPEISSTTKNSSAEKNSRTSNPLYRPLYNFKGKNKGTKHPNNNVIIIDRIHHYLQVYSQIGKSNMKCTQKIKEKGIIWPPIYKYKGTPEKKNNEMHLISKKKEFHTAVPKFYSPQELQPLYTYKKNNNGSTVSSSNDTFIGNNETNTDANESVVYSNEKLPTSLSPVVTLKRKIQLFKQNKENEQNQFTLNNQNKTVYKESKEKIEHEKMENEKLFNISDSWTNNHVTNLNTTPNNFQNNNNNQTNHSSTSNTNMGKYQPLNETTTHYNNGVSNIEEGKNPNVDWAQGNLEGHSNNKKAIKDQQSTQMNHDSSTETNIKNEKIKFENNLTEQNKNINVTKENLKNFPKRHVNRTTVPYKVRNNGSRIYSTIPYCTKDFSECSYLQSVQCFSKRSLSTSSFFLGNVRMKSVNSKSKSSSSIKLFVHQNDRSDPENSLCANYPQKGLIDSKTEIIPSLKRKVFSPRGVSHLPPLTCSKVTDYVTKKKLEENFQTDTKSKSNKNDIDLKELEEEKQVANQMQSKYKIMSSNCKVHTINKTPTRNTFLVHRKDTKKIKQTVNPPCQNNQIVWNNGCKKYLETRIKSLFSKLKSSIFEKNSVLMRENTKSEKNKYGNNPEGSLAFKNNPDLIHQQLQLNKLQGKHLNVSQKRHFTTSSASFKSLPTKDDNNSIPLENLVQNNIAYKPLYSYKNDVSNSEIIKGNNNDLHIQCPVSGKRLNLNNSVYEKYNKNPYMEVKKKNVLELKKIIYEKMKNETLETKNQNKSISFQSVAPSDKDSDYNNSKTLSNIQHQIPKSKETVYSLLRLTSPNKCDVNTRVEEFKEPQNRIKPIDQEVDEIPERLQQKEINWEKETIPLRLQPFVGTKIYNNNCKRLGLNYERNEGRKQKENSTELESSFDFFEQKSNVKFMEEDSEVKQFEPWSKEKYNLKSSYEECNSLNSNVNEKNPELNSTGPKTNEQKSEGKTLNLPHSNKKSLSTSFESQLNSSSSEEKYNLRSSYEERNNLNSKVNEKNHELNSIGPKTNEQKFEGKTLNLPLSNKKSLSTSFESRLNSSSSEEKYNLRSPKNKSSSGKNIDSRHLEMSDKRNGSIEHSTEGKNYSSNNSDDLHYESKLKFQKSNGIESVKEKMSIPSTGDLNKYQSFLYKSNSSESVNQKPGKSYKNNKSDANVNPNQIYCSETSKVNSIIKNISNSFNNTIKSENVSKRNKSPDLSKYSNVHDYRHKNQNQKEPGTTAKTSKIQQPNIHDFREKQNLADKKPCNTKNSQDVQNSEHNSSSKLVPVLLCTDGFIGRPISDFLLEENYWSEDNNENLIFPKDEYDNSANVSNENINEMIYQDNCDIDEELVDPVYTDNSKLFCNEEYLTNSIYNNDYSDRKNEKSVLMEDDNSETMLQDRGSDQELDVEQIKGNNEVILESITDYDFMNAALKLKLPLMKVDREKTWYTEPYLMS